MSLSALQEILMAAVPPYPVMQFSVIQYHNMIRAGILHSDMPVELLDGWLIEKMPKNPRHRAVTRLLRQALEALTPSGWYVDSQEPITTADSEPEPDIVIVRGDTRDYLDRHPGPTDLALVVEVADATLRRDREMKRGLYARAGISYYWIVNLVDEQVEVYAQEDAQQPAVYPRGTAVPVVVADERVGAVQVDEILP